METPRSAVALKTRFRNLKGTTSKKLSENKSAICGTGGGPAKIIPLSEAEKIIAEMLGTKTINVQPKYDDDVANNSDEPDIDEPLPLGEFIVQNDDCEFEVDELVIAEKSTPTEGKLIH